MAKSKETPVTESSTSALEQTPGVGRIVHYYGSKDHTPEAAIVTQVHDALAGLVDLTVFPAGSAPEAKTRVLHKSAEEDGAHWAWPRKL